MIVDSERDQRGVRTITLNRPPANAIDHDMMHAVRDAFDEATADWDTKVVVLDSANPRFFSGGWTSRRAPRRPPGLRRAQLLDVDGPRGVPGDTLPLRRPRHRQGPWHRHRRGPCSTPAWPTSRSPPTRRASASSRSRSGPSAVPGWCAGLSEQAARYLSWSGRLVPVTELTALGAGIRVVPAAALDEEVDAIAELLAGRDQQLLRHMKLAMNQVEPLQPLEAYTFEQMHSAMMSRGADGGSPRLQPDHVRDLQARSREVR